MTSKAEITTSTGRLLFIEHMPRVVICFLILGQSRAALWEREGMLVDVWRKAIRRLTTRLVQFQLFKFTIKDLCSLMCNRKHLAASAKSKRTIQSPFFLTAASREKLMIALAKGCARHKVIYAQNKLHLCHDKNVICERVEHLILFVLIVNK